MNPPGHRLLSPETLSRVERLARRFRWRFSTLGALPGRGDGRRLGRAGEFEGYRSFGPGDDLRHLDVKVYARLRRPMVRVSREDSMVPLTLLVDRSASMVGDARRATVAELATFFVHLARRLGDPVRLFTFADGNLERVPARDGRSPLQGLLEELCRQPRGDTDFRSSFRRLPVDPAGRGAVVILSDGWGLSDPDGDLAPLGRVGLPFWLAPLEPEERHPSFSGKVTLVSRESEPSWSGVVGPDTHREYELQLARYYDALRRHFLAWGGDFLACPSERSLESLLTELRGRRRMLELS